MEKINEMISWYRFYFVHACDWLIDVILSFDKLPTKISQSLNKSRTTYKSEKW